MGWAIVPAQPSGLDRKGHTMKRTILTLALLLIPTGLLADTIVHVDVSNVTFVGNSCVNCTETFNMSFNFLQQGAAYPQLAAYSIVPGTFTSNDFGFLGTSFTPIGSGYVNSYYMPFLNSSVGQTGFFTEIDMWGNYSGQFFTPGQYNAQNMMFLYSCATIACEDAFNTGQSHFPTSGTITISLVSEPSSLLLMAGGILGLCMTLKQTRK